MKKARKAFLNCREVKDLAALNRINGLPLRRFSWGLFSVFVGQESLAIWGFIRQDVFFV